jgi:hypothetical protein
MVSQEDRLEVSRIAAHQVRIRSLEELSKGKN